MTADPEGRAVVVCSILERDARETARALAAVPRGSGLVEIRGDTLRGADLADLVGRASRPVVATIRRSGEGGTFDGSEEERAAALEGALRAGARWIDVEWSGSLAGWANGPNAARIVLSQHGVACRPDDLRRVVREMRATRAGRLKVVASTALASEIGALREVLAEERSHGRLAAFAGGRAGVASRVLACAWGSWGTYGALVPGAETAPGQLTADDLLEVYRALEIGPQTRCFALLGTAVSASPSPAMHAAGYREAGIDGVYLPLEVDALEQALPLLDAGGALAADGLGVTMPFKEAAAARCAELDDVAARAGSVNTVRLGETGWHGWNTDGPAIERAVRAHVDPRGRRVAVAGAGGTARAAAAVLVRAGAEVTLYARDPARGAAAAARVGARVQPFDELGRAIWDVLVQATPLGRSGERVLEAGELRGALVLDLPYGPEPTPLVRDARRRGLAVVEGFELLVAQAEGQFERLCGARASAATLEAAGRRWLAARRPR